MNYHQSPKMFTKHSCICPLFLFFSPPHMQAETFSSNITPAFLSLAPVALASGWDRGWGQCQRQPKPLPLHRLDRLRSSAATPTPGALCFQLASKPPEMPLQYKRSSVHASEDRGKLACSENALTLLVNWQNTGQGKMSVASTKVC